MTKVRWSRRLVLAAGLLLAFATPARADFWGGDLVFLAEIVANTAQELIQLRQMLQTGEDTLGYMQTINKGVDDALALRQTMNTKLSAGSFGNLQNPNDAMHAVQDLYGLIPKTAEANRQRTTDQTVAEAIDLHNEAYRYAEDIDPTAESIKSQARIASPQGAAKLTAESVGVLIHVMDQVLRTNAAMLALQGEQLAMHNRQDKLSSQQFLVQYGGLSTAFKGLTPNYNLPSLSAR